ncbi:MAG: ABC transporter ATP-binding protein [Anaerolineae bacterium]
MMIRVEEFSYRFSGSERYALRDIDLDIAPGEFIVLTGPSGCGKSTLALALGGFLFNQYDGEATGEIAVAGMDVRQSPVYDIAEVVGLVQQNPEAQFCTLTVQDEIAFGLENRRLPRAEILERMEWALNVVEAQHLKDCELARLSGGEKQRIAVAAMLAARPQVLIFDEPTSNMDPTATAHIFDVIARIREMENITVIVIEHKVAYLDRFAPRWLRMESGQLSVISNQGLGISNQGLGISEQGLGSRSLPPVTSYQSSITNHQSPVTSYQSPVTNYQSPITNHPPLLIKTERLHAGYNGHHVLHDISVEIGPGEFVAVMGDNGSGKTTFLQCLLGLLEPAEGHVEIAGQDTRTTPVSKLAQRAAYVFQNPDHQLFAETVWQEATLAPRNFGAWNDDTAALTMTLLDEAGLIDRRNDHPYRLSYGEKRRLNLAAVLTYAPTLLLLDEILIGQDPDNATRLLDWLQMRVAAGSAVVLINHAPDIARRYATRLLFFEAGRLAIDAPIDEGFAQLANMGHTPYLPYSWNTSNV